MSASAPIVIIGAGLSGLSLARTLLRRNIPALVYEKSPIPTTTPRHTYGLTLKRSPTWDNLKLDEHVLVNRSGQVKSVADPSDEVRVHRARLEEALSKGLTVKWERGLKHIFVPDSTNNPHIVVSDATTADEAEVETITPFLVISCEGVHSRIRRQLLPDIEAHVLPWVVYRGKQRLSTAQWTAFRPWQNPAREQAAWVSAAGQRLELKVDEWKSADEVAVSYTYSRRAHDDGQGSDALHQPGRETSGAKAIPPQLYEEIGRIQDMPPPFQVVYDIEKVKKDRLLHWLMRTLSIDQGDLQRLASKGILFLGEAARAKPILGGEGANDALEDGRLLGEWIAERMEAGRGIEGMGEWYGTEYWRTRRCVEDEVCHAVLVDLHLPTDKVVASDELPEKEMTGLKL